MTLLEEEEKMTHILDQVHAQLKIKENFLLILFYFSLDRLTLANTFTSIVNKNGSLKHIFAEFLFIEMTALFRQKHLFRFYR